MNNKTIAYAIVAILAVAAVGVGIYYVYGNNDDPDTTKFLMQVGEFDPIWIEGEGDTVFLAFVDACEKNEINLVTDDTGWGIFIDSINGLGMFGSGMDWIYWGFYYYAEADADNEAAWVSSPVGITGIEEFEVEENIELEYFAFVYSGIGTTPLIEP